MNVEGLTFADQRVPDFYRVFPGHPDFVAQISGVAGAGDIDGNAGDFSAGDAKIFQVGDIGVGDGFQEAAGSGALHRKRGCFFGDVFDVYVQAESVLLEPAEAGVGGGPAVVVFAEARDGAVVDDFAFGIAPAAVDDLVDCDLINVAGDDAVDELGGVASGDAVFEEGRDVDERGGVADGVVLVLVVHFVNADGVIAGPFAIVEAFAEGEGAFVEGGSYWHWGSLVLAALLVVIETHRQECLCHETLRDAAVAAQAP